MKIKNKGEESKNREWKKKNKVEESERKMYSAKKERWVKDNKKNGRKRMNNKNEEVSKRWRRLKEQKEK